MKIMNITDAEYSAYGRVLTDHYDVKDVLEVMSKTEAPDHVVYYPSIEEMEVLPIAKVISESLFGGMPIQMGYCNGTCNKLNAVEYHRCSEIGIAQTDLILLLGKQQDIEEDFTYDTSKIEAFFVPAGTVYEMYATTLHYAPSSVDGKPYRNVVILPKGTNEDLQAVPTSAPEDRLLVAVNKWLIAHEEAKIEGAFNGLKGENVTV